MSGHKKTSAPASDEVLGNEINFEEEIVMNENNTVVDMRKFVGARNGEVFTSTQQVAEAFEKLHNHVIAKVRALDCSAQFLTDNFSSVQFEHRGNTYEAFEMTKDGFMFLVMSFTGKKAAAIKEGYISAFNWMAEQLGLSGKALVTKVVVESLGAEGALIISNVMRCRVAKLPEEHKRSAVMKLASALHARFGVPRIELIPGDQLEVAANFVASYGIEGEYIQAEKSGDLNMSLENWVELCPITRAAQAYQPAGRMILNGKLVADSDTVKPLQRLITKLKQQGVDVSAYDAHYHFLLEYLRENRRFLADASKLMERASENQFAFRLGVVA